jgi:hypothetical protein
VWHELVLHGIGGATVEEAKGTLTHDEFVSWAAFMRKRGSLNLADRIDAGFAMLAHVICAVNNRKTNVADFMPKHDHTQQEGPSIHEVFGMLKAQAKKGKK